MLEQNVADGVHRVEDAHTNWYLVQDGTRLTVVDTGLPRSWASLHAALRTLDRSVSDIEAVVLTHAHFDHMGFAERARRELGLPLWAHPQETSVVAHPWRYHHERSRVPYLRHPEFLKILAEMTAMGAPWVKGSEPTNTYDGAGKLDIPGRPKVIFTPGHTYGHCSLLLEDRGTVLVGDAFVMLDPYTGRHGPCVVAGAATADSARAIASLDALATLDADLALTGHGPPWRGSMSDAVARAKAAGAA
jgi:glyoxylase-like metal-dependent hydrolase (beta-lactamase superfamily II)